MGGYSDITVINNIPEPFDLKLHIKTNYNLKSLWNWIRPRLLYNKLLGFRENFEKSISQNNKQALKLLSAVNEVKDIILSSKEPILKPKSIYKFYKCRRNKNSIIILDNKGLTEISKLTLTRQNKPPYLCISDYLREDLDYIAFFVVTSGREYQYYADIWKNEKRYMHSIILQSLALSTVEGLAELTHKKIRINWGIDEKNNLDNLDSIDSIKKINPRNYRGLRYSFGYPSCPNLSNQQLIWKLLNPHQIGVTLTEDFMMEPEASISALVIHHPQANYFSIKESKD